MFLLTYTLFSILIWKLATGADVDTTFVTVYSTAWIIEERPGVGWDLARYEAKLAEPHKCKLIQRQIFNSFFFVGGSFEAQCISRGYDEVVITNDILVALEGMDTVSKVWQMDFLDKNEKPPDEEPEPSSDTFRAPVPSSLPSGLPLRRRTSPKIKTRQPWDKRAEPQVKEEPVASRPLTTHLTTGVDQVHAAGFLGTGIRIAVIDKDFNIQGLSAFSKTKIAYRYSVVDGSSNVETIPGDCVESHGGAVLSVIGANSDDPGDQPLGFKGVAPDASFELIKVARCDVDQFEDEIIAGLLHAADRGVDIISASLGGATAYPDHPRSVTVERIQASGILVAGAMGNDGRKVGIWDTTSLAGARGGVMAVGSTNNLNVPYFTLPAKVSDGSTIPYVPGKAFELSGRPLTLWLPGDAQWLEEGCNPLPVGAELPADPENTILVMAQRHCWVDRDTHERITAKLGIRRVMFYVPIFWTHEGLPYPSWTPEPADGITHYVTIKLDDFELLKRKILAARHTDMHMTVTFPPESTTEMVFAERKNEIGGNYVSSFSSWGPTLDGRLRPGIVAPGGDILTTLPKSERGGLGWAVSHGTSMSTPFYAGTAALLKQKFLQAGRNPTSLDIQTALTLTAKPLNWFDFVAGETRDYLAPVYQQGAGSLDAWAASNTRTLINTTSLDFNDTMHRPPSLTFQLSHLNSESTTYRFDQLGAASGYVLESKTYEKAVADVHDVHATVQITPAEVTIPAGESALITVSITKVPDLPDADRRGVFFGGYISIVGARERLHLPYAGFASALIKIPMINRTATILVGANETHFVQWPRDETFHCQYNVTWPVPLRCEANLVPAVSLKTTIPSAKYLFHIVEYKSRRTVLRLEPVIAPGRPWPKKSRFLWDGTDRDKQFVPAGRYYFEVLVLHMYGDIAVADDYEIWESPSWYLEYEDEDANCPTCTIQRV
ncbi:hypothetical protein HYFRA_00005408 [Hymenoscyphus fraxineus]|uniref:Subtilisin-like protein n=1 Tax=Hymenoscyphus fraxineus TaxID=746836 RepID=A0A9N9PQM1_9HELO|nr:hypothetical protein HYFRA_00005408 [Hymenoscyphus fraxineus]